MAQTFHASALVPRGIVVDEVTSDGASALITVRSIESTSICPGCGTRSGRVHSRYHRCLADLPIGGRPVRLMVRARRFYCRAVLCGRRVFAERFDDDMLAPWARRTARLDYIVHHLGLALGGRPAASFARRLMVPVSKDTLLRVIRRRGSPPFVPPTVIGIDDWAWRRNQRYGTLICDLERRRTIALLPDREPATARDWLSQQPQIAVVARSWWGICACRSQSVARCDAGCRRLAPNGKCEPRFSRRGAQVDASYPLCDRRGHDQPRPAHGCRKDPIRRVSPPRGR